MKRATAIALCAAAAMGCSGDDLVAVPGGKTGNPSVVFTNPSSAGSSPHCVEVPSDTSGSNFDFRLPMLVSADELDLRPPGACLFAQCGHLQLKVNGVFNNEASVPVVELLFRKLGDRFHDGSDSEATGVADVLHVTVDVVDSNGDLLFDHSGEPLRDEIELITVTDCP